MFLEVPPVQISSDPSWLAVVALIVGLASPIILVMLQGRQKNQETEQAAAIRRAEKQLDWDREDKVAEQAAKAAALLLAEQKKIGEKTNEVARKAAESAKNTEGQLKQIHALVNNNLTTAINEAYMSKRAQLAAMNEIIDLKRAAGKEPSLETMATIGALEKGISDLAKQLMDREQAAKMVAAEQAKVPMHTITEEVVVVAENVTVVPTDKEGKDA